MSHEIPEQESPKESNFDTELLVRGFKNVLLELARIKEAYRQDIDNMNKPDDEDPNLARLDAYAEEFGVPITEDPYETFDAVEENIQGRIDRLES